ncbi:MAG: 2-oxoacid:acceptor oxidoreductase family protein [Firmicutes bacterium]|nr:2-oxoacid:acceptor oxidoreductase family protein [Bacillota bacterium]
MAVTNYLLAGFGGQGVLFAGKFLANLGLIEGKYVSWLPSYGPEMRGGTCNCSVVVSDEPVGSPVVSAPDVLMVLNLPSLDKFENTVRAGGTIYMDTSFIERKPVRKDVKVVALKAAKEASENGMLGLANMILLGKLLADTAQTSINKALEESISAKRTDMLALNLKALAKGKSL